MRDRIASVRQALADAGGVPADVIEERVAASTVQLGMVARLLSPALAVLVLGAWLDPAPPSLWRQDVIGGPVPLSAGMDAGAPPPPVDIAVETLLSQLITPLNDAVIRQVRLSGRVLWGNVASTISATSRLIGAARPDLADRSQMLAGAIFQAPQLRTEHNPPRPGFRRSSCCLYYRLAPERTGSTCSDCVLA